MTINTWRNDILKVCKYCELFWDTGKSRNRYLCTKHRRHIYYAKCSKTLSIRKQASEISKEALSNAFFNLTGKHMDETNS